MKKLILLAMMALSATFAAAETYTFHIGVNDYPMAKDEKGKDVDNDLYGCVNDANAMLKLGVDHFGVKKENTKLLLDGQATGTAFLDGVKWLLGKAKAGDQVVFSYSGHGAQVVDEETDEEDGKTELIVLADMTFVQDDFFAEIAKLFTLNGVNATFVFDSCHSGGMSRKPGKIVVLNKSLGVVKAKSMVKPNMVQKAFAVRPRQIAPPVKAESVFLFASQEDKTSKDLSGMTDIPAHGIFTLLLLDLVQNNKETPIKDLFDVMTGFLTQLNGQIQEEAKKNNEVVEIFDQGPNFEASADRSKKRIIL